MKSWNETNGLILCISEGTFGLLVYWIVSLSYGKFTLLAAAIVLILSIGILEVLRTFFISPLRITHFNRAVLLSGAANYVALIASVISPDLSYTSLYILIPLKVAIYSLRKRCRQSTRLEFAVLFGLMILCSVILISNSEFSRIRTLNTHDLVHLGYLAGLKQGQVMGVDTFSQYNILYGYSIYVLMSFLGFSLHGFHSAFFWLNVTFICLSMLVVYRHVRFPVSWLVALLLLLTVSSGYAVLHHPWGWPLLARTGFSLIVFSAIVRPLLKGWKNEVLVGFLTSLHLMFSLEHGIATCCMVLVYLVSGLTSHGDYTKVLRPVTNFFGGLWFGLAPLALIFTMRGALGVFVDRKLAFIQASMAGFANLPFPPLTLPYRLGLTEFIECLRQPFFAHALPLVLCVSTISLVCLKYLGSKTDGKASLSRQDRMLLSLSVAGVVSYQTNLVRPDFSHLFNALPPVIMLTTLIVDDTLRRKAAACRATSRIGRIFLSFVLTLSALLLTIFFLWFSYGFSITNMIATIDCNLVTKATARERLVSLEFVGGRVGKYTETRDFKISPSRDYSLADYLELAKKIREVTTDGDAIFVKGRMHSGLVYFLADRAPATPYHEPLITYLDRNDPIRDYESILTKKPKLVVYEKGPFAWTFRPPEPIRQEIADLLSTDYRPLPTNGPFLIQVRTDGTSPER